MSALRFAEKKQLVEEAVARLEQRCAAEVVCVVATESGRYDRAEDLLGVALGLIGLAVVDSAWDALHGAGGWGAPVPLLVQAAGVVLGFVLGALLGSFVPPVRRLLVSHDEAEDSVQRAACAAFTASRVGATAERVGVLVYVSLFEHRVVVLLDEGVKQAAGDAFAQALVQRAVEGLKAGGGAEVLAALVDHIGESLAQRLPAQPGKKNELPDHLIVLHPR